MRKLRKRFGACLTRFSRTIHPAKLACLGYLSYIFAGWAVLSLPWLHKIPTSPLDNLFIASSAVSTTGLATIGMNEHYTLAGQIVILVLIQLGGVGYMTFGSFVILSTRGSLPRERTGVGKTVFSLPESFDLNQFIRSVVLFTFLLESVGTLALWPFFSAHDVDSPFWAALFHSVSAFCTAGFSTFDTGLEAFRDDFWINAIIALLSIAGAIGFIVWVDWWQMFTGKAKQITLTSRIILWSLVWMLVGGTALIALGEPSFQSQSADKAIMQAFFQTMSAMTTVGFNTVPIGSVSNATLLVLLLLMVVGASPSGTGGGVKSTTVTALFGIMRSALAGREEVRFWGHPIPIARLRTATASLGLYLGLLLVGTYLLELTESATFDKKLFEAASALGTVGLSTGITAELTNVGKLIVIGLMFCGRMGALTFGMALFFRAPDHVAASDQDLAI